MLIGIGGGSKALWKIVLTTLDTDVTWMEQMLFPFLSTRRPDSYASLTAPVRPEHQREG